MKKIKYSPDAADKLRRIKREITNQYGENKAKEIIKTIRNSINDLCNNEKKGPQISELFDIITDYRYLIVSRNYVFYRIDGNFIRIINIYHEREDFMYQLFVINTIQQDIIDYWEE